MGDLIILCAAVVAMAVVAFDAVSAKTSSVDVNTKTDKASGEVPAGKGGNPADVLLDSPHYDKYKSVFDSIWAHYRGRDEPQYKFDWLLQSLDMGRELETDGFYVMKSIEKDLPYFCETEHEFEMFFKSEAPVSRNSVRGILDIISFYLYREKHSAKQEYWKQHLLGLAQNGYYEAQAALCTSYVRNAFPEQELVTFKETYESNLIQLAEAGSSEAQLAVGEFLMQKPPQKIAWLTKAAQQELSDAWYQLGLTYESMINIDDDGQFKPNRLSDAEVHQLMVKKAECFLNGANANNGILHVRRQILRQNEQVVEAPLKTKNSYRSVPIGADAIEVLEKQKKKVGNTSEYVFPSPTGSPMSPDSVLHMLQRVLKRAAVTAFQVIRYSPARSSSAPWAVMLALSWSLMASASAWASSIRVWSWRSSRTLLSISFILIV